MEEKLRRSWQRMESKKRKDGRQRKEKEGEREVKFIAMGNSFCEK